MLPICESDVLEIIEWDVHGPVATPKMAQLDILTDVIIFKIAIITIY